MGKTKEKNAKAKKQGVQEKKQDGKGLKEPGREIRQNKQTPKTPGPEPGQPDRGGTPPAQPVPSPGDAARKENRPAPARFSRRLSALAYRASVPKKRISITPAVFVLFSGIAVWLVATAVWEARNWNRLTMDEVIIQLSTLEGVGNGMVEDYLRSCVLPGALALGAALVLTLVFRLWRRPLIARSAAALVLSVTGGMLVYAVVLLDIPAWLTDTYTASDYIELNYVDPLTASLKFPERKRNLICIWLESMESTFADTAHGGAFPVSPIPELTALAEANTSFTGEAGGVNGGFSMSGATWTAGALFAQTSGLPLKIPVADSAMDSQEAFFPGMTNLGDILEAQGYRQALLIGSDAAFGGRGMYFTQHGNYEIWDYKYSVEHQEIPEDYKVWWGYEDEKLFQFAREHLTELAEGGEPFNLSILTADTHFPDGYVCRLCGDEFGDDQYSNVMACSSRQVGEFVAWVQEQPFYENTTIVLAGDHITMDADYCDDVAPDYPRRIYTVILNPAAEEREPSYREYSTMDLFPTTLAALGVEIKGGRLGLGTDLFSGKPTLLERDGYDRLERELKRKSEFMDAMSGIGPDVFQWSEDFANTVVGLDVDFGPDTLTFTMDGLEAIEPEFTVFEVFAEIVEGDTRTTLWNGGAARQEDGSYQAVMPTEALQGNKTFSVHFYGTTGAGRIRIDSGGYLCDLTANTAAREEPEETEGPSSSQTG